MRHENRSKDQSENKHNQKREDNKVENDLRVMNMKKVGEKYRRTTRRGKKPGRRKKKNWQKLKEN